LPDVGPAQEMGGCRTQLSPAGQHARCFETDLKSGACRTLPQAQPRASAEFDWRGEHGFDDVRAV